jgi:hypothetical protein
MKAKWECPNCPMSSTRHWNVRRHINSWHAGSGQPVAGMDLHSSHSPSWPSYFHKSISFQGRKYPTHKTADIMEDILEPFRKAVEFKNLLNQLSTPRQQHFPSFNYNTPLSMTFNRVPSMNIVSNNNISEPPRTDGLQIIGCRGYICQNCLITVPMKVYCSKSRGIFVSAHECDPQRLQDVLFMQEANRHNILYQLHAELPQLMRKVVNASEVQKQQIPQDNYTELNITNENDWAARAIKR